MRLAVLVDNQAGHNLQAEWGLSFYIEANDKKILFDFGASGLFIQNAAQMNIPLTALDFLALSHGHWDHSWGLENLLRLYLHSDQAAAPTLIAHPSAFLPKFREDGSEFGLMITAEALERHFTVEKSKEPYWITENLVFLGEIRRQYDFEADGAFGQILSGDSLEPDLLLDDSALVYKSRQGLVIITGCAHSGICNIIEAARQICREERVLDVIGGYHLLDPDPIRLEATLNYLKKVKSKALHPCHCTDLYSKIALSQTGVLAEVASGLQLLYE